MKKKAGQPRLGSLLDAIRLKPRPLEVVSDEVRFPSLEEWEKVLGKRNILGPDFIKTLLGVSVEFKPPTFNERALEFASEHSCKLIYRINRLHDEPLTMDVVSERYARITDLPVKTIAMGGDEFWNRETPRTGWALVATSPLRGSVGKGYPEQTQLLRNHLRQNRLADPQYLTKYSDRVLHALSEKNPGKDGVFASLDINCEYRRRAVEAAYDLTLVRGSVHMPPSVAEDTNSLDDNGSSVTVGFIDGGILVTSPANLIKLARLGRSVPHVEPGVVPALRAKK